MKMKYNTAQRVFIVKNYTKTPKVSQVQSAYRVNYKVKRAPSRRAILYNNAKLDKTGAVVHTPPQEAKNIAEAPKRQKCLKIVDRRKSRFVNQKTVQCR